MSTLATGRVLLAVLEEHANNGWVCPSLPGLAKLTNIGSTTVSTYLTRLCKAGDITMRLVHVRPHGQARVVTIVATGRSTRMPEPTTRYNKPADPPFTPTATAITSRMRRLTGEEFARRAAELIAREEQREKREMMY